MNAQLRKLWGSRAPRERAIVAILSLLLAVALYGSLVVTAGQAGTRLRASVMNLRAQVAGLELQATELERLRVSPPVQASQTDLRLVVEMLVEEAGLSRSLVKINAPDGNQVVMVIGPVEFSAWLAWIDSLKTQQVRLSACRIEAMPASGMVSASATLMRANHR